MEEKFTEDFDHIRENKLLETMSYYAKQTPRKNLTSIASEYKTRDSRIVMMLIPEWAPDFPPYNLARLSAITKAAGYETIVYDVNEVAYSQRVSWDIDFNPWDNEWMVRWFGDEYFKYIHQQLEPLLIEYVEKVIKINPTVIAFTIYDCNKVPVKWFIEKVRERLPDVVTICGGAICNKCTLKIGDEYDYVVSGEGEDLILRVLEEIELNGGKRPDEQKLIVQELNQRIDLDTLPMPDYSHFNLNGYKQPNAVAMELSRGCSAKCSFCDETHYWKYRDRMATRVLEEIHKLNKTGVNLLWFIDSLVNGNLKQFRAILKGLIELREDIDIKWTGQGRVDRKMDDEFFEDIKKSGCISLAFGVESGSNRVLEDMCKGITREEVEQNFFSAKKCGLSPGVMLIPGFPTETPQDFYETLMLLWRIRDTYPTFIGAGLTGCNVTEDTVIGQRPDEYKISPVGLGNNWMTKDFRNTRINRLFRMKMISIFLEHLTNDRNMRYTNRIVSTYKMDFMNDEINEINYEEFDFDICKKDTSDFINGIFQEWWVLLRLIWRTRGPFKMNVKFDPEIDIEEFSIFLGCDFSGEIDFEINEKGEWKCRKWFEFKQDHDDPKSQWQLRMNAEKEPDDTPISRAKALVLKHVNDETVTHNERLKIWEETRKLDLSFSESWSGTGKWQRI